MALDDATQQLLKGMAEQGGPALHEMTVEQARQMSDGLAGLFGAGPEVAQHEVTRIPVAGGTIAAHVYKPSAQPEGAVIYYHGGGWVIGSPPGFDTLARKLAVMSGCTVVLPDYRLAPEYRFPTAADDAYATLEWTSANLDGLARTGAPIIVAGDSAGGNLSTVTALRSRDRKGPRVAFQALVYPVTDCRLDTESYLDPANELFLTKSAMEWFWDHYVPDAAARTSPDASPLRAELANLPPAIVLTAEQDVLRDEGEAYAAALKAAGNDVEMHRIAGQMHGFFTMPNLLPGHDTGMELVISAVKRALR